MHVKTQLDELIQREWVVYGKAYIKKPDSVVAYLSRYTHKIAISDQRIEAVEDSQVRFGYKDYRDGKRKSLRLPAEEFIRRFLLHVPPSGFMRIRHYGFLSNRSCARKLNHCRLNHRRRRDLTACARSASWGGCTYVTRSFQIDDTRVDDTMN